MPISGKYEERRGLNLPDGRHTANISRKVYLRGNSMLEFILGLIIGGIIGFGICAVLSAGKED